MTKSDPIVYVAKYQGAEYNVTPDEAEAEKWRMMGHDVWEVNLSECDTFDGLKDTPSPETS